MKILKALCALLLCATVILPIHAYAEADAGTLRDQYGFYACDDMLDPSQKVPSPKTLKARNDAVAVVTLAGGYQLVSKFVTVDGQEEPAPAEFLWIEAECDQVLMGDVSDDALTLAIVTPPEPSDPLNQDASVNAGQQYLLFMARGAGTHEGSWFYERAGIFRVVDGVLLSAISDPRYDQYSGMTIEEFQEALDAL